MSVGFGEAHLVIKIRKIGVRCIEIIHELGRTEMMRAVYASVVHHDRRHWHQYRLHLEIFIYIVQLILLLLLLVSLWIFEDAGRQVAGFAVIQRAHSATHHKRHHLRRVRHIWRRNDVVIHRHQVAVPSVQCVATSRVVHLRVSGHVMVVWQCR